MSYIEIILLLLGLLIPFIISQKNVNRLTGILPILIVGMLLLHLLIDGLRWQMFPIYLILLILLICLFTRKKYFAGHWFWKIASGLFLFILLSIGSLFSTVLPIFDLPTPSGKYQVGTEYLYLESNNEEFITDDKNDKRALMLKVWYPAQIDEETNEAYLNDGDRQGFASKYGLPKNIFNYLDKIETHTFNSPKFAEGKFPILIFSHGYYSKASGYYALIEEIVSQGYIVFNINHTYESVGSLFPSGEIKLYDSAYDQKHNNEAMASMVWEAMQNYKKTDSKEEQRSAVYHCLKNYFAAEITKRWSKDISIVLDEITSSNKPTFLSNHMDTNRIGVFGHSQGGAAAGQALLEDSRISAGINIDGTQWGNMIDTFLTKPFLLLSSDWPENHPDFNEFAYQNGSQSDFYKSTINNSGHSNFMDIPFMVNSSLINEAGDIEPTKAIKITSKLVGDFFNTYLKKSNNNLLDLSKEFPELEIKKISTVIE